MQHSTVRSVMSACAAGLLAALAADPAGALEPKERAAGLQRLEFFAPELYVSNANVPLDDVVDALPNAKAWRGFVSDGARAFIDPRSGAATNLMGAFPLLPGDGVGNKVTLESLGASLGRSVAGVDAQAVAEATVAFVASHRELLGVDLAQLGRVRAVRVNPELWHVNVRQQHGGVPVRDALLVATISHGNLVSIGTQTWGRAEVDAAPRLDARQALEAGFAYAGGRAFSDVLRRAARLEIVPVAPREHQVGEAFAGPVGAGYRHRLVWTFVFQRPPDDASWEVLVDAHSGEVIAFQDVNHYAGSIVGGVYPITSTEICPTPQTCGALQSGWPMPWANTGFAAPNNFTNSGGVYNYSGGTATSTLTGIYVGVSDNCGARSLSSATGDIDWGGTNGQHDCTTPGFGGAGNTASSRSSFYELNKIAEQARGWLPGNTWLQSQLPTNVNINNTCNAFYSTISGSVNFYRSGGGCRNTGEIAGVFDHEWGHGLDDNDSGGALSNTSEAYADIAMLYRLHASCIGHGFWWTSNRGCGTTADGTGFNANEAQVGAAHCDTDCSGVRDADWAKHADNTPDTALGFVCSSCSASSGPCGRQVHCAAAPPRQAAWDLVARDLPAAGFDSNTAFIIGNRLFYQGSGNIGLWYNCTCGGSSNGCGAANAYTQWISADDDNGNLNDGTPHMAAIFAAFDRHGIACASPTPQNGGCAGGPTTAPTLTATPGDYQAALSWSTVASASEYWVFRTEGVAGCNFGKALIAKVAGTSYTDTEVAGGRQYHYTVVAAGASSACFGPAAACQSVTPTVPPPGCDNDGVCEAGEDCNNCANDCPSFPIGGTPGNNLCEAGDGETCYTTSDCNGTTSGNPNNRFCCGFNANEPTPYAPDGCGDARCNASGNTCTEIPVGGGSTCCGDGLCQAPEDAGNCALDCGAQCVPSGQGQPCTASTNCCSGVGNCTGGKPASRVCQ